MAYSSRSVGGNYNVMGGLTHYIDVPVGDYSISVTATPIETVYGRVGIMRSLNLTVCATEGGANPFILKEGAPGKGGGIRPSRVEGC